MQKIFYNATVYTMNEKEPCAEAFFVNDGAIVFVGSNEEVLQMKQDDVEIIDLKQKTILPTFFDCNARVYDLIEQELKNAKKEKYIENNSEFDENYEKFCNYNEYKKIFLKLQKEFLRRGVTTILEMGITPKEFVFWKKISEEELLEIDVIAYVDMLTSKQVMDDNCRSYRKYKKHFRLGGYYLAIDGELIERKACLNKPYKHEKGYKGYSILHDEQMFYLFKSALEEKKQLVVETNGDHALDQFISCFERVVKEEKVEDVFRPIALKCNIVSKDQLKKLKELKVSPAYQITDLKEHFKLLKRTLGGFKANKIQPFEETKKIGVDYVINSNSNQISNPFELLEIAVSRDNRNILGKKQKQSVSEILNVMLNKSAYLCFDQEQKGSLENGKLANFVVCDDDIFEVSESKVKDIKIIDVYLSGDKIKK